MACLFHKLWYQGPHLADPEEVVSIHNTCTVLWDGEQFSFLAVNHARTRFGCLHPITRLQLYTTFALPRILYGAEIWCLSKTEVKLLKRPHSKILRMI